AEKETVAAIVDIISDDLSGVVDALREGAHDGQRVVERGVGVDGHEMGSSVDRLSCRECRPEAEPVSNSRALDYIARATRSTRSSRPFDTSRGGNHSLTKTFSPCSRRGIDQAR